MRIDAHLMRISKNRRMANPKFDTIRGKFSSVHPDLAAEGITRVELGEGGLHFTRTTETGPIYMSLQKAAMIE